MSNLVDIPQDKKQLVEIILKSTDLYKCIFVSKQATTTEISKQFKKVSILVHPDKNDHPKSSEAFKKVGEAKRILTDDTARRRYDQTGSTSDRPTTEDYFGGGGRHYGNPYGPTAEDIFEQFFTQGARSRRGPGPGFGGFYANENPFFTANFGGGGNPFFQHQAGPRTQRQHNHQPQGAFGAFGPLLGIFAFLIIMFLVSMMTSRSSTPTQDPFSLWQTDYHSVPHSTSEGLSFWLNPGHFDSATLLKESTRKGMDRDVYQAWYKLRESECSQDLSQARQKGMPNRPKACVQFDEIKAMKNQRAW